MTKRPTDYEKYGVTPELFSEWRSPRCGAQNPSLMTNPVWEWLIRSKHSAYAAAKLLGCSPSPEGPPTWSFDRLGQSCTELLDGSKVYIAGEHEDHYDPDFCIYNDIVVEAADGSIAVYGYPKDRFPPTDFHSATLVGSEIILVGNLGYAKDRVPGNTQVLSVDLHTFSVRTRKTFGNSPGWIHEHHAALSEDGKSILVSGGKIDRGPDHTHVENLDDWSLNLQSGEWKCLVHRQWPRWQLYKADLSLTYLWEIRQALWNQQAGWDKQYTQSVNDLEEALGGKPDVLSVETLYRPRVEHIALPEREEEYGVYRIQVNGITVRYVEEIGCVVITVEGNLPADTVKELIDDVQTKLSKLENNEYNAKKIA